MKALAISLLLITTAPALANTAPNTTVERRQTTTVERDNDSDWGWLGLLGLAGLAGLLRKNKREPTVTTYSDGSSRKL